MGLVGGRKGQTAWAKRPGQPLPAGEAVGHSTLRPERAERDTQLGKPAFRRTRLGSASSEENYASGRARERMFTVSSRHITPVLVISGMGSGRRRDP